MAWRCRSRRDGGSQPLVTTVGMRQEHGSERDRDDTGDVAGAVQWPLAGVEEDGACDDHGDGRPVRGQGGALVLQLQVDNAVRQPPRAIRRRILSGHAPRPPINRPTASADSTATPIATTRGRCDEGRGASSRNASWLVTQRP